jgi:hypothetical protein
MTETPALEIGHEFGPADPHVGEDVHAGATIDEALAVIDRSLAQLLNRELVSTDEVADVLLDVRSLLTRDSLADN